MRICIQGGASSASYTRIQLDYGLCKKKLSYGHSANVCWWVKYLIHSNVKMRNVFFLNCTISKYAPPLVGKGGCHWGLFGRLWLEFIGYSYCRDQFRVWRNDGLRFWWHNLSATRCKQKSGMVGSKRWALWQIFTHMSSAFSVRVVKYWNRLPAHLVLLSSVSSKKQLGRQWPETFSAAPV